MTVLSGARPPVEAPESVSLPDFATRLFSDYVDRDRRLILVGTPREIPLRDFRGLREGDDYFLDIATDGAGTFQPIFHIDMFITLLGAAPDGRFEVMVGIRHWPTRSSAYEARGRSRTSTTPSPPTWPRRTSRSIATHSCTGRR